ncbi:hypothetical protein M422DRAFT_256205 [Sphaerobolus stellatus SS14]|uniref:Uncharacterized protein n=1 Tax=Sphaerobolus stellatus (strain SS14) TaxID=990650 RepID=A0A0C9UCF9_SPHS4|nr:hypothetical protein M422DRAFT_256205 [Sphaerobolus stellatus SS14]
MYIRGIKLTNKDRDHLGNDPFEVLADVIPALDFDYMSEPENSECVIDLGISASPEADQPMVSLWNLTNVDASFAQAGTNTPHLFNVGTLTDYGAVSAEYTIDRASVIQMRYCMAYNLIFEIVHGNIQFPENSDAYAANGTFHAHINQIINLYTNAKQSSYVAKQKMAAYVNAETVIWISSRIYFDCWIRRIQELKFLQKRVAKQRPSNACNLTLLNMYLIKSIVTNPHEDSFTRFVLQDLNFQPSSQHFGIFFLPTLHRHTLAVHQMEQDDDSVIQHVTSTHGKRKQCQKDTEEDPRRTEEYPLGTHPSWREITDILNTNPTLIVHTRSNLLFSQSENGQIHQIVIQLLCKWTHNYSCTINPIFLTEPENYPQPENWEDILNFWTVNQIQDTFHAPAFLPHKSHWKDKKTGINSQPWRYHPEKGGPSFIVNAKAYKICGIGPPKKNTNLPCPRAIATHTRIEALLLADNLNISFNDAVKHIKGNNHQVQRQERRSAKHKNKRKPSQKIQRSQGSSANENQEIHKEQLEEDSEEVNGDSIQEQEQDQSEDESDYFNIDSEDSEDSEDL